MFLAPLSSRAVDPYLQTLLLRVSLSRLGGKHRHRVNHINAQEAQGAQGVVLGEFLVSSTLATVLFESGASHSFISSSFVDKHNVPTILLKTPLLTRTPEGDIKCQLGCFRVRINLSGVEFLADLVVLKSKGIDVILGMDWLSLHNGLIG